VKSEGDLEERGVGWGGWGEEGRPRRLTWATGRSATNRPHNSEGLNIQGRQESWNVAGCHRVICDHEGPTSRHAHYLRLGDNAGENRWKAEDACEGRGKREREAGKDDRGTAQSKASAGTPGRLTGRLTGRQSSSVPTPRVTASALKVKVWVPGLRPGADHNTRSLST
jgi:hypothetical protein